MKLLNDSEERRDSSRGQVGIGTLIVFIAMVLVAAIAAGVLINTSGFLQQKSQQTGEESTKQVSNRIDVVSTVGITAAADPADVQTIEMIVTRSAGSGDLNLSQSVVQIIGPDGSKSIQIGPDVDTGGATLTDVDNDGDKETLGSDGDKEKLTLDLNNADWDEIGNSLAAGQSATIKVTTPAGGTTTVFVEVPSSTNTDEAIEL